MIRRAFAWTFAAQGVSFCVQFGGSIVIARLLSPHEMGIFAVSVATIGVLQIITSFGIGNFIVRAVELDQVTLDTAFTLNAALGVSLGIAIFLLSFVGGAFLGDPGVAQVMHWLALIPIIGIVEFRPSTMLQREMRWKHISFVTTVQAVMSTGVMIIAAYLGASYLSPAFGGIASAVVGAFSYTLIGRDHVTWRMSTRHWRVISSFGFRMMSIGGVSALAARLCDIILGHFLGLAALGLYSRANNLSMLIFTNIYGTATRVIFAKLSQDYRERGELRSTYLKGLRCITAIMGPILIGLAILAGPAIHLLYGDKWLEASWPLSLLLIAQFITLRYAMNWELFVIKDELRVQTRIEITRSIFSVVTRTIGSLFSTVAAAAAAIVDGVLAIFLYGRQINRMLDTTESEMLKISGEAVLLTAVATAPSFALMMWFHWEPSTSLVLVFGSVVLGAGCWLAAMRWMNHPVIDELQRLFAYLSGSMRRSTSEA